MILFCILWMVCVYLANPLESGLSFQNRLAVWDAEHFPDVWFRSYPAAAFTEIFFLSFAIVYSRTSPVRTDLTVTFVSHDSSLMISLARSTIHFVELSVFLRMAYVSGLHDAAFMIAGCFWSTPISLMHNTPALHTSAFDGLRVLLPLHLRNRTVGYPCL